MIRSSVLVTLVFGALLPACQQPAPATPAPAAEPAATTASGLPPARQILDRYVQAVGGREAFQRIQSIRTTSTLKFPGFEGEMIAYAKRPNRLLVRTTIPGVGEILTGFDGEVAWSMDPVQGPRLLTGRELDDMRERANFDQMLKAPSSYTSAETIERTTVEGQPASRVRLVRPSGREEIEFYHPETGLQLGQISTQQSAMGEMQVTTIMGDDRRFGPVLLASSATQRLGPQEISVTVNSVEYDTVADSVFALPPQIKALAGK